MATSAVQKFFTESKKRVNKDILGGLIQILDFEVVATNLGPRDSRLTILVKEFKGLGSEGSSIFGGSPRPIEVNREVQKLSERLKRIRTKGDTENQHYRNPDDSGRDSTVTSQNDFDLSSDDSPMTSQQALATQAQLTVHPTKQSDKEPGSPTQQDAFSSPAHVAGIESSSPVPKQITTPSGTKPGNSDIVINEKATSGIQAARHPSEKSLGATTNEVKKPKNVAGLLALLPTLIPKAHLIKSMTHSKLISKTVVTTEKSVPEKEKLKDQDVAEPPNMVSQSNRSSIAVEPGALVKEKESLLQAERNLSAPANDIHNPVETIDGPKESKNVDSALAQVSI